MNWHALEKESLIALSSGYRDARHRVTGAGSLLRKEGRRLHGSKEGRLTLGLAELESKETRWESMIGIRAQQGPSIRWLGGRLGL